MPGTMTFAARLLVVTGIALLGSAASHTAGAEPVRSSIVDLAGRPISIEVTVGQLTIEGWSQPGVQVDVVPEGRGAGVAGTLDIAVEDGEDAVTIRAVQPNQGRDPERRARVSVKVPATATIRRAAVFEGRLVISGIRGQVQASIERGPLVARGLAGIVRLETQSGDLSLEGAELIPGGLLRLRTFNGSISLGLAVRPANARILALTLNGAITSTLPLTERAGFGPRFREGVLGSGEPLISLDAVRGDLAISAPER